MITIEYLDEYCQRYITSSKSVTLGTEFTTEVYTPYVYGQEILTRKLDNSIEVFGIITIITQVFNSAGVMVAEGSTFETNWIEIWKKCWVKPDSKFKHHMNCRIVDVAEYEIVSGPAFITPGSLNNAVWGDVTPGGSVLPPGTGEINFEFIDVWS
jgi:hypothetical protein